MKTAELQGAALDWAVAKCEGRCTDMLPLYDDKPDGESFWALEGNTDCMYSTRWNAGGPIIERERIALNWETYDTGDLSVGVWVATVYAGESHIQGDGPTPLVAAMRCFVASKLGDDVEIPQELL